MFLVGYGETHSSRQIDKLPKQVFCVDLSSMSVLISVDSQVQTFRTMWMLMSLVSCIEPICTSLTQEEDEIMLLTADIVTFWDSRIYNLAEFTVIPCIRNRKKKIKKLINQSNRKELELLELGACNYAHNTFPWTRTSISCSIQTVSHDFLYGSYMNF